MEEKMKEMIRGIYEKMTDDQKEKARACKTMDELLELANDSGVELPDELLDSVAGGIQAGDIYRARIDQFGQRICKWNRGYVPECYGLWD